MAKTNETAWALVNNKTGKICHNLDWQKSIHRFKSRAQYECPTYAKVIKVRITEVKTK